MVIANKKLWIILTAAITMATACWWWSRAVDDRTLITRQLRKFSDNASKYSGEGTTQAIVKSKALEKIFAKSCRVELDIDFISGTFSPEEIAAKAISYRRFFDTAVISLNDIKVETISTTRANATMTAALDGRSKEGKRVNEFRDLECTLEKPNDIWLISGISIKPILEK